jgi:hypothetical protein
LRDGWARDSSAVVPTEGEQPTNQRARPKFPCSGAYQLCYIFDALTDGLQRTVCVWGWNIIGIIGLAMEGLLAFLSLALVGLMTFAFLAIRAKQLGRLAGRLVGSRAAPE